ncbi:MAG: hypothetical protein P8Z80_03925 [Pseudolabrys sp.]
MADYEPLIARAIAGLEQNTGENRRVLYGRARGALLKQLRGVDPPLEEGDITRERLALEEAIRKIEAEVAAQEPAAAPAPEAEEPAPPPESPRPSLGDGGLKSFRQSMAQAEGLGGASAEANRAARESFGSGAGEPPAPSPETHYFEPESEAAAPEEEHAAEEHAPDHGEHAEHEPFGHETVPPPPFDDDHAEHAEAGYAPPVQRSYGRLIALVVVLVAVLGVAATAYWQRDTIKTMVAGLTRHSEQAASTKPAGEAAKPAAQPKIADRIGSSTSAPPALGGKPEQAAPQAQQSATAPAAGVAQKVVLYEEDPNNPKGKRYVGSAIWRTVTVSPGPGLAPELAVRADVDIPERHMRMTWSLRRNTDKTLPASHTIEITFTLPANFDEGGIGNVPGVLMKNGEQARGIPLAGLSVKVTNGYFLIGLSAAEADKQRNVDLLKTRQWFDIPIVYTSGKRAILAVEKGPSGDRAFKEAFRAWGE